MEVDKFIFFFKVLTDHMVNPTIMGFKLIQRILAPSLYFQAKLVTPLACYLKNYRSLFRVTESLMCQKTIGYAYINFPK